MERDLVHVIASDMHNLDVRPPYMEQAYDIIAKKYGAKKAKELLWKIPEKL